jgi:putative two-component system response regulator
MARVLVVDDEPELRSLLCRVLDGDGHDTVTAEDVPAACAHLARSAFELVLCDVNMPGRSGLDFIRDALATDSDLAVVMVTAVDDPELAGVALELGAYGYVVKPFRASELSIAVGNALRRRRLEIENRSYREHLEQVVLDRTAALRAAVGDLERKEWELQASREETIYRLARAAESRNQETGLHIERVSRYSTLLAMRLGLEPVRCELIRLASPLHDIGKIAISDRILLKPGALSPEERREMEDHAELGQAMLAGSGQELLDLAADIAWTHHERFDGLGYPRGLVAGEIPIEGRIVAVADVFDALTSERVYRPELPVAEALSLMSVGRGTQLDPDVLDMLLDSLPAVLSLKAKHADERLVDTAAAAAS